MQRLVMVTRTDRPKEPGPESEGLLVDTDTPGVVRLVLDDGVELDIERDALLDALHEAA